MIENITKKQKRNDTYILNQIVNVLKLNFEKVNANHILYNIWWYIKESRKAKK